MSNPVAEVATATFNFSRSSSFELYIGKSILLKQVLFFVHMKGERKMRITFEPTYPIQKRLFMPYSLGPWEKRLLLLNSTNGELFYATIIPLQHGKTSRGYATRPGNKLKESSPRLPIKFFNDLPEPFAALVILAICLVISRVIGI